MGCAHAFQIVCDAPGVTLGLANLIFDPEAW
jgi:hypothetical protein